jgi:outer membrane receptor protein involved in Fe transport
MSNTSFRRRLIGAAFCGVFSLTFASDGWAQIEEIIVSARKREESLQEVPVAISAFTAENIQQLGINDLDDLGTYTSSLIFDTGFAPQDTKVVIRGLSPVRGRQNVAILQDGIDISSQAIQTNGGGLLINPRLFDLERIEIVKGPQNALYGRTAFNGAINYVTRKPTDSFSARVSADIGDNGLAEVKAGVSGPILGSTLLGDLNVAGWNFDGFYTNTVTGEDVGGEEGRAAAGSLEWRPNDDFRLRARAEWLDDEFESFPYQQIFGNTQAVIPPNAITSPAPGVLPVLSPDLQTISAWVGALPDGDDLTLALSEDPRTGADYPGVDRDIVRFTLTGEYELGGATLTYLGHVANAKTFQFLDATRIGSVTTEIVGSEYYFEDETDLQSHEIRLASSGDGPVQWTVGGLLWTEEVDFVDGSYNCINNTSGFPPFAPYPPCAPIMAAVGTPASPLSPDLWSRETDHWSVYGLVDWAITPDLHLILEGRYTEEELDVSGPDRTDGSSRIIAEPFFFPPLGNIAQYPPTIVPALGQLVASQDDDFFSPKATVQWEPSDNAMLYFSWAQAAKPAGIALLTGGAGGFNPEAQRFEREEMTVWELGAKTDWLDGRLILNGAAFFQDYSDKQVSVQQVDPQTGLLVPRTENASSAEVFGLELDAVWLATDWLQLRASYTYLDTEYTDYLELTRGAGNIALASVNSPNNCRVVVAAVASCELDLSGNQLEYAPEHAAVLGFTLTRQVADDTELFFESDVVYQGERFVDRFNAISLDSYTLVDFRLGVRTETWDVLAYVENAFEDDTVRNSIGAINTRDSTVLAPFPPFNNAPPFTVVLPPSQLLLFPDQRQFGIRANYRFGGQ